MSSHWIGPETVRLMRRPRFGLVSRSPGGPGQPSAGITTGCLLMAARCNDDGAVATAPEHGAGNGLLSLPGSTAQGVFKNAASGAPGGASYPIARGEETPSHGVSGGFASRSGSFARSRVCRRSAPLDGSRELQVARGRTRRRHKNTGDGACLLVIPGHAPPAVIPGRERSERTRNPYAAASKRT